MSFTPQHILVVSLCLLSPLAAASTNTVFSDHLIRDGFGYAYAVMSADIDNDGDQDLTSQDILGNPSMSTLHWFENDGEGTFQRHVIATGEPGWFERHALGDISGDGLPDVAIVNNRDGHVVWFENNDAPDAGPWQRYEITTTATRAYDVVLVDIDNDTDLDAAVAGYASGEVNWFVNPGSNGWGSVWTKHLVGAGMPENRTIRFGDFNRDGRMDLFASAVGVTAPLGSPPQNHACQVVWYENPPPPQHTGLWSRHDIDIDQHYPIHGHPVDLDKDGDLDAVMAFGMRTNLVPVTQSIHQVAWYEDTGSPGTGQSWQRHTIGELPQAFEAFAADIDLDTDIDVIASAWAQGDRVVWFENSGSPFGLWTMHDVKTNFVAANQVIVANINSDVWPDIVAAADDGSSLASGDNELRWFRNDTDLEPPAPPCENETGFIATQSPNGNPPDAAHIYRADGTLVKKLPIGYWYQEFDNHGNLYVIHHTPDVGGDYPVYRYDYLGGTNWADAVIHCLLDPVTNGTPEALCIDADRALYIACKFPAARPIGMGVYAVTNEMANPVFFAAMDNISGHTPKDLEFGPGGKLWMWTEIWGILRWPVGGDTAGFELRVSEARHGGIDFSHDGFVYGCVNGVYPDFGYYDLSGAKAGDLFSDPYLDATKNFYNMDFGPDKNGDGVCDIYVVMYYDRVRVYDGADGTILGDMFSGFALRSISGVSLPRAVPGSYLILK